MGCESSSAGSRKKERRVLKFPSATAEQVPEDARKEGERRRRQISDIIYAPLSWNGKKVDLRVSPRGVDGCALLLLLLPSLLLWSRLTPGKKEGGMNQ